MSAPVKAPVRRATHRMMLGSVYLIGIVAAVAAIVAVTLNHAGSVARKPTPHPLWQTSGDETRPTYVDGLVLTQREVGPDRGMIAHDILTGAVRWQFLDRELLNADPSGTHVYYTFYSSQSNIGMATTTDGAEEWRFSVPAGTTADLELVTDTQCWVVGRSTHAPGTTVYVLDARTGRTLSTYALPVGPFLTTSTAYVIGKQNDPTTGQPTSQTVSAFDAVTGKPRWSVGGLPEYNIASWTPANGALFFTGAVANSATGVVMALDEATGKQRWSFPLPNVYPNSLLVTATAVYVYGYDTPIYALDPASGHVLWQSRDHVSNNSGHLPHLLPRDGVLYVGQLHAPLLALDAATGQRIWQSSISGDNFVLDGSFLAVNGDSHYVVELNARDGSVAWDWWAPNTTNPKIAAGNGRVVVATPTGLVAFNDQQ